MADDILDIIHRISFNVDDTNLEQLTAQLRRQTETINHLGQRQARLAQAYDRTSSSEIERRRRISSLMERNNQLLQQNARSVESTVLSNRHLNEQLTRELGLIGAINTRLDLLRQRRRQATSETDVRRYSGLIANEQRRLDNLNRVPRNPVSGLLGNLGQMGGAGSMVSSIIPQVAGALSIAALGGEIVNTTKKFESYIQTLKNAYGSGVKAEAVFSKIQQFAAKTPYSVDELTSSFIKLKNRGFDPTTAELTKMGDIASSQGKSFDQLVEAVLDAQTGENERLKEFGIKAQTVGDHVTFTFKGVSKTVSKFSEVDIRNAILGFGELQGVVGGMAGQATTLDGKLSNLGDTWDMIVYSFTKNKGIDRVLANLVDNANDLLNIFKDLLDNSHEIAVQSRKDAESGKALISEYEKLANQTKLTANEKDRMRIIQSDLVKLFGDSVVQVDKETGAYKLNIKAVKDAINAKMLLANTDASTQARRIKNANDEIEKQKRLQIESKKNVDAIVRQYDLVNVPNLRNLAASYLDSQISAQYDERNFRRSFNTNGLSQRQIDGIKRLSDEYFNVQNGITGKVNKLVKERDDARKKFNELGFFAGDFDTLYNFSMDEPSTGSKTTDTSKKEKKGKTAHEIALDKIKDAQDKAIAEEEESNSKYITLQNELLKNQEINEYTHQARIERNESLHQTRLFAIQKEFAQKRIPYQKSTDRAGSKAEIAAADKGISDVQKKAKEDAENEIEEAIKNFNELNDQLLNLQKESDEKELEQMRKHHKAKLDEIDKQTEEEKKKLIAAQDSKDQRLEVAILNNIKALEEKKKATSESFSEEERKTLISQFNKKIDKQTDLQIDALNSWSDNEKREFVFKKESAERYNNEEITILKQNGQKKQELQERIDIAALYIQLKAENEKMTNLISSGKGTEEEIKKQQKSIDDLSKQIRDKQGSLHKDDDGSAVFGWGKNSIKNAKKNLANALKSGEITQAEYDEQIRKLNAKRIAGYAQTATDIAQTAQTIVSAFEQQADREIEIRQRRVDQTREIADRGNAEALQEEERRLDKAVKAKERFAKQQMAINLLMQASAIALAIAEAAAASGGIGAPVGIAIVLAALATGFAAVKGFQQDTPAFKDGVIGFNGKGTGTSDSNLVRISNGESVITAEATRKNREILEQINAGNVIRPLEFNPGKIQPMPNTNSYDFTRLENKIESLKNDIKSAISERTPNSISIDRRGFIAMTEEVQSLNRKRDKL